MKHLTLKELPVSERPYEKCEQYGAKFLSDAELIAVIIKSGSKGERSIEVANHVLNYSKDMPGLQGLNYLTLEDLMTIRGIGKVKAIQLLCVAELTKRMARQQRGMSPCFSSPEMIADYYMQEMRCLEYEQTILVLLDTKCHRMKDFVISKGTVNSSLIEPREVLITALKNKAVQVVLLHNHPSGDITPSNADVRITKRLKVAFDVIGIPLLDHIIIGDNSYMSFQEQGLL